MDSFLDSEDLKMNILFGTFSHKSFCQQQLIDLDNNFELPFENFFERLECRVEFYICLFVSLKSLKIFTAASEFQNLYQNINLLFGLRSGMYFKQHPDFSLMQGSSFTLVQNGLLYVLTLRTTVELMKGVYGEEGGRKK